MDDQGILFPDVPIPEWLPDELLFSLLSRFHRISGNFEHAETCQQLFGPRRKRCAHDLPHWLEGLSKRANGVLGTSECIVRKGTLLPVYLPFMSPSEAAESLEAIKGQGLGRHRARLCRQTAAQITVEPLRACPQCMQKDQNAVGVAYWHLSHQVPGVLVCIEHRQPLWRCTIGADGTRNVRWHLPQTVTLSSPAWTPNSLGPDGMRVLEVLAKVALRIFATPYGRNFEPARLRSELIAKLIQRKPDRRPCDIEVLLGHAADFQSSFGCLATVPEFVDVCSSVQSAAAVLAKVVCETREPLVPWNQLRVIAWLAPNLDTATLHRIS